MPFIGASIEIASTVFHPASNLAPPSLPEQISKAVCPAVQQLFLLELNLERSEVESGKYSPTEQYRRQKADREELTKPILFNQLLRD